MILIADCGATSIDWGKVNEKGNISFKKSKGINFSLIPIENYEKYIRESIPDEYILNGGISKLWFYAAGCRTDEQKEAISSALKNLFPTTDIYVDDDLIGAARALCGDSTGIACIIGTGSNACLYSPEDGGKIVKSVPPLGYILGDEGSGTYIGKRIISDAMKGLLSSSLTKKFYEFAGMDRDEILSKVYMGVDSNTFIASFAIFAKQNRQSSEIQNIIYQSFESFISRNVLQLIPKVGLPVGFVGSIAHTFLHVLQRVMEDHRLDMSLVLQSPIEGLVNYHINYLN